MKKPSAFPRPLKITLIVIGALLLLIAGFVVIRSIMLLQRPPKASDYAEMASQSTILSTQFMFMDSVQQKRMGFNKSAQQNRSAAEENSILNGYINSYKKVYWADKIKGNPAVRNGALKQPYDELKKASDEYVGYVELFARDYEATYKMKMECQQVFERSEPFVRELSESQAKNFDSAMFKKDTAPCRDAASALPSDALYKDEAKRIVSTLDHVMAAVDTFSESTKDQAAVDALTKAGSEIRAKHPLDEAGLAVAKRGDTLSKGVQSSIDRFKTVADQNAK